MPKAVINEPNRIKIIYIYKNLDCNFSTAFNIGDMVFLNKKITIKKLKGWFFYGF